EAAREAVVAGVEVHGAGIVRPAAEARQVVVAVGCLARADGAGAAPRRRRVQTDVVAAVDAQASARARLDVAHAADALAAREAVLRAGELRVAGELAAPGGRVRRGVGERGVVRRVRVRLAI